jgi:site-specific recombinase XerD
MGCNAHSGVTDSGGVSTTAYLVGQYVQHLTARRCSPETIRTVRYILRNLALATGKRLDELQPGDLEEWQARRAGELGGRTLRSHVSYVRCFYGWCVLEGHVRDDPTRRMCAPKARLTVPRPMPEVRLVQALAAADAAMAAILGLAAFAGLRACEIARLEWADCYLDEDEPYLRVLGKGDRERIADCSLELRDLLRAVPGSRRGAVFKRADGRPGHNTANRISKLANEFLHDNDVPDTLHSLRHRFGTEIARRGGIRRAQVALGHASISATQIYAEVTRSEVRPLVEQVGKLLA